MFFQRKDGGIDRDTNRTIQIGLQVIALVILVLHLHSGSDTNEAMGGTILTGLVVRLFSSK